MTEKRDKVNVEDIIGLIKTNEPTDSVEEVRKLRGREDNNFYWYKKYKEVLNENEQLKHELHTLTGLYAFDKLGKGVEASDDSVTVPRKDLIKLDYGDVE